MTRRERREFTAEFKLQMVTLFQNGKPRSEIIKEYDLTPSAFNKWVKQYGSTQSFKHADNLTEDQKRLIAQEKELKQLRMENDILKQAALIMGRK
jgi:transposase